MEKQMNLAIASRQTLFDGQYSVAVHPEVTPEWSIL
jgi:hypothetical protein